MDEDTLPLVARKRELDALVGALRGRRSRLISGPAGVGKTRLIEEALTPAGVAHTPIPAWPDVLREMLAAMAASLGCLPDLRSQLWKPASAGLKAAILRGLRVQPRCVVLDHVRAAEPRTYRFLKEVYYLRGCSLVVAASSRASIGYLWKLP